MSIFSKDLVERPVFIPIDESIKCTVDWTANKIQRYLSSGKKPYQKTCNYDKDYCRAFIRESFNKLFDELLDGSIPEYHPEECKEYPPIYGYHIDVWYEESVDWYSTGRLYYVRIEYKISQSFNYIVENIQMFI